MAIDVPPPSAHGVSGSDSPVISGDQGALPSKAGGSRLEALFGDISLAVEEGRLQAALRLADCACRAAPKNPTCLLLYARLLIRLGAVSEAAERLQGRGEPEAIIARGEALCAQGLFDTAATSCEMLLRRFAVDSVEGLPAFAVLLCRSSSAAKFPGWVGVDTRLRLVGQVRPGSPVRVACGGSVLFPTVCRVDQDGFGSFMIDLPTGVSGRLTARTGDCKLLGSDFSWPPEFGLSGWVMAENKVLLGEVYLDWAPALPVKLAIGRRGGEHIQWFVVPSAGDSRGSPFSVSLQELESDTSPVEVSALLPDGTYSPLTGSPVRIQPLSPTPVGARPKRSIRTQPRQEPRSKEMIDIVVPVYAGFGIVRGACSLGA